MYHSSSGSDSGHGKWHVYTVCVGGGKGEGCGANNDNCGINSENTDGYCGGALANGDNKEEWMVYTRADNNVGGFNGENNGSVICTGIGRVCSEILWLLKTTPTSLPDTSKRTWVVEGKHPVFCLQSSGLNHTWNLRVVTGLLRKAKPQH